MKECWWKIKVNRSRCYTSSFVLRFFSFFLLFMDRSNKQQQDAWLGNCCSGGWRWFCYSFCRCVRWVRTFFFGFPHPKKNLLGSHFTLVRITTLHPTERVCDGIQDDDDDEDDDDDDNDEDLVTKTRLWKIFPSLLLQCMFKIMKQ